MNVFQKIAQKLFKKAVKKSVEAVEEAVPNVVPELVPVSNSKKALLKCKQPILTYSPKRWPFQVKHIKID